MAISMKLEGIVELAEQLEALGENAQKVASSALYDGAGEMAKAIRKEAEAIKTAPFKFAKPGETRLPSPEEKQILLDNGAMGIAKFEKNGAEVNTSVGYNSSGYADVNWNHMSSQARTNYKDYYLKGKENNASSFLKALGMGKGEQNRKPVGVIANAINSGTSFMKKQPFVRQGASKGAKHAEAAITRKIEQLFDLIIKESGGKSA